MILFYGSVGMLIGPVGIIVPNKGVVTDAVLELASSNIPLPVSWVTMLV